MKANKLSIDMTKKQEERDAKRKTKKLTEQDRLILYMAQKILLRIGHESLTIDYIIGDIKQKRSG